MPKPYTEYQKEMAFDRYYAMGPARNLDRLALDLVNTAEFEGRSPSLASLKLWSTDDQWQERCKQRDIENSKPRQKETDREVVKTKAGYRVEIGETRKQLATIRSRYEKLVADATKKIMKGEIEAKTIQELDQLASSLKKLRDLDKDYIKLDLQLIGEDVPDRSDLNIILKLPEDLDLDDII